jgi:hypothetical protein
MSEIFRFPNGGYEVTVCRKKDIIDSIEDDSVDKEILDALIEQCERDAEILYSTQESNWANDDIFNNIFALKSPEELVLIGRYYYKKTGVTLIDAIEKKMNGKVKAFFRELLYNVILPAELFAEKIYEAIKGIGTNTTILNRVLATRNEIDMTEIRELYKWKYKVNMKDDIIGDTSGNYQNLCVYLSEK